MVELYWVSLGRDSKFLSAFDFALLQNSSFMILSPCLCVWINVDVLGLVGGLYLVNYYPSLTLHCRGLEHFSLLGRTKRAGGAVEGIVVSAGEKIVTCSIQASQLTLILFWGGGIFSHASQIKDISMPPPPPNNTTRD